MYVLADMGTYGDVHVYKYVTNEHNMISLMTYKCHYITVTVRNVIELKTIKRLIAQLMSYLV